jgi:hypothetical protein
MSTVNIKDLISALQSMPGGEQSEPAPAQESQPAPAPEPPVAPAQPRAVAPRAPSNPVHRVTSDGLYDIFNLTVAEIDAIGPQNLRTEFEKIISVARGRIGAPPVPDPSRSKNRWGR